MFVGEDFIEVPVEIWLYNLGPNKLMRRLRFEGGYVVDIDTLGYGYNWRSGGGTITAGGSRGPPRRSALT